ncbi:hypothetical protein K503DRAFT_594797 [Rhizopogon vinicolor AM-OR11-026]|uniref:Uncharacterized protein n=1 Tax=Rhizopogon vinicolor AM-OR11-026 TaxID=1314800 RepID=A0A1B7N715_9AGAM|nr:hypothetical protein K503DRAFT_594797 [Rhizopogon vinicolor AM-OR11-026]
MCQSCILRCTIMRQQAGQWEDGVKYSRQQSKRCPSNRNHVLPVQVLLRAVSGQGEAPSSTTEDLVMYGTLTMDFQSTSHLSWSAGGDCDRPWSRLLCGETPFRASLQCNRHRLACWWSGSRGDEDIQQAASWGRAGTLERRTVWSGLRGDEDV